MPKPQTIWKGGRPRKAGPREPNGRLARDAVVLPPCMEQDGLALGRGDYQPREVTERGQVIGRTFARVTLLGSLLASGQIDGDEYSALGEYEKRLLACRVNVQCNLGRAGAGGGCGDGLLGVVDGLLPASEALAKLRAAALSKYPHLWQHLEQVFLNKADPSVAKLKEAAALLIGALERRRA